MIDLKRLKTYDPEIDLLIEEILTNANPSNEMREKAAEAIYNKFMNDLMLYNDT